MTFDLEYHEHGVRIVPHFCREWEDGEGCYGTNPHHGFSWEEAREELAKWHDEQAAYWRNRSEAEEYPVEEPSVDG